MTLQIDSVVVRFGGVVALNGVSGSFQPGAIQAVIGPNGSGKSTLFNSITGFVAIESGNIVLDGASINALKPQQRICAGVSRTFQTPRFDAAITVEEAVLCGFYPSSQFGFAAQLLRTSAVRRNEQECRAASHEILHDLGLAHLRKQRIGQLPMGQVRMVEVARAIANRPKYILLDEPAAGLTRDELDLLGPVMVRLASMGIGVVLVEHNFELVCNVASHVLVLNRGTVLASGTPDEVRRDQAFIEAYLGSSHNEEARNAQT